MATFKTIFRAAVMVAVGVIGVKGWHLYGPTNEQVKSTVTHAIQLVQSSIQSRQDPPAEGATVDPRLAPPPIGNTVQSNPPIAAPPVMSLSPAEAPRLLPGPAANTGAWTTPAPITPLAAPSSQSQPAAAGRMPELMSRLEQLGAAQTTLSPWGDSGHLFRFSCQAPLASTPTFTQHFESVAAEPEMAVAQVVAKVEAWRVAQRGGAEWR